MILIINKESIRVYHVNGGHINLRHDGYGHIIVTNKWSQIKNIIIYYERR